MRYGVTVPIPVYQEDPFTIYMPTGLYRDIVTHSKLAQVRLICARANSDFKNRDAKKVDLKEFSNLSVRILPYGGGWKGFLAKLGPILSILKEEAQNADVWTTGVSTGLFDLTTVSYQVGRRHARRLRVFCLDSDPASMVAKSGARKAWKAGFLRRSLMRRARGADVTFLGGKGVSEGYLGCNPNHFVYEAVWLLEGDLAQEGPTLEKYAAAGPVKIALPTRLSPWKGADDAIEAMGLAADRLGPCQLEIIGDGEMKPTLVDMVGKLGLGDRLKFVDPVPYGEAFFQLLRQYHIVLVPTRGLEDARIVYDAAASGCVLVHSNTTSILHSTRELGTKWGFEPGNPASMADALVAALAQT
jgi:glycosyltransferase involved in cell wall biosynthesis